MDRILDVLDRALGRGGSLLLATHDERLLDVPDVVVHMDEGRVVDIDHRGPG